MKWSSAVSDQPVLVDAINECAAEVRSGLGAESPDLVIVFVSEHHSAEFDRVPALVVDGTKCSMVLGCSASGVIGDGHEIERRPGVAMTAARLPDVDIVPFHILGEALPDADAGPQFWEALVGIRAGEDAAFVVLTDPFTFSTESLTKGLDFAFPHQTKVGGLASGAAEPGGHALFLGGAVHRSGAVGLSLRGDVTVDAVVAQGCRPIAEPLQVTSCDGNLLLQLDGQPPLQVLSEIFQGLDEKSRQLAEHSLFLGIVMNEINDDPQLGDFLIRNIVGGDHNTGALAVVETLKEGQMVQFHLRDAVTSSQDLDALLLRYAGSRPPLQASGALLFSCLGRGLGLYGHADHDTDIFRDRVGRLPLTGFFGNGEIGPVGDETYLHGYTSAFGIVRPRDE